MQPARTILFTTVANTPGSLHRLLGPFAERGLNLCKLESRPTGEPWTYRFIIEIDHTAGDGGDDPGAGSGLRYDRVVSGRGNVPSAQPAMLSVALR